MRNERANLVSRTVEGRFGWVRDPYDAPEAVAHWKYRFPSLPIVADGRESTGFTRAGRGTTAFDLFRMVNDGGLLRCDFLSLKTDTIADDGKLPSKIELATGNPVTMQAILDGINNGASLPTMLFCSPNDFNGEPMPDGVGLFLDLGPILRGGVAGIEGGPYARGKAPPAYFKWSSARKTGGGSKGEIVRGDLEFPHVDEQGRKWLAFDRVCYPELIVSLAALGISRRDWTEMSVGEIPAFLEAQEWEMNRL